MKRWDAIRGPLLVFVCCYLFFLCTLAGNFSGPHDSLSYLNNIISGDHLFHQHHLLYHFVNHYWLKFIQPAFPGVTDYYLVEAFTALWGSGSLSILFIIFRRRFNLSVALSIIGTTLAAFSYGMWLYSVNVEVYAIPLFFIFWSLLVLTRKPFRHADLFVAALLQCMAILFHQINILFSVVILYKIWEHRRTISPLQALTGYALIGIVLVGGLYFLIGWVYEGNSNLQAWGQWIRGYSTAANYWQPLSLTTFFHVGVGYLHALVGGHYMFRLPLLENYLINSLATHALQDEIYLSRNISATEAVILSLLTLLLLTAIAVLLFRLFRKFRTVLKTFPGVLPPILICWGVYTLFFCFWMPEILEFWILQTVLLWIVLIGTLQVIQLPFRMPLIPVTGFMSLLLVAVNYFGSIRQMQHIENDLYFQKVKPLREVITPKDVIVVQDAWILKDFLEYYMLTDNIRPIPTNDSLRSVTDNAIRVSLNKKGKIYVYPQMNNQHRTPDRSYIDSLLKTYAPRTRIYRKTDPEIWVIE